MEGDNDDFFLKPKTNKTKDKEKINQKNAQKNELLKNNKLSDFNDYSEREIKPINNLKNEKKEKNEKEINNKEEKKNNSEENVKKIKFTNFNEIHSFLKIDQNNYFSEMRNQDYIEINNIISSFNEKKGQLINEIIKNFLEGISPNCDSEAINISKYLSKELNKIRKLTKSIIEEYIDYFFSLRYELLYSTNFILSKKTIKYLGYILSYVFSKLHKFSIISGSQLNFLTLYVHDFSKYKKH